MSVGIVLDRTYRVERKMDVPQSPADTRQPHKTADYQKADGYRGQKTEVVFRTWFNEFKICARE